MGATLYCSYYPEECINDKVLPYLRVYDELPYGTLDLNGKHLTSEFYSEIKKLSDYNEEVYAYIFNKVSTQELFDFASSDMCPPALSDYITNNFEDGLVLIIYCRELKFN